MAAFEPMTVYVIPQKKLSELAYQIGGAACNPYFMDPRLPEELQIFPAEEVADEVERVLVEHGFSGAVL